MTIITPCSRPENLDKLYQSIRANCIHPMWFVCYDLSKVKEFEYAFGSQGQLGIPGGVSGNLQRNKALKEILSPNEWVYCLDDDNLLHPNFSSGLYDYYIDDDPYCTIITFDQQLEDGTIRKGNNPQVGFIDQAQFLIRRSIHEDYEQNYNADGMLISKLIAKYPDRWLYIPETLSYYNKLQWK